jgi:hypothetical protein
VSPTHRSVTARHIFCDILFLYIYTHQSYLLLDCYNTTNTTTVTTNTVTTTTTTTTTSTSTATTTTTTTTTCTTSTTSTATTSNTTTATTTYVIIIIILSTLYIFDLSYIHNWKFGTIFRILCWRLIVILRCIFV